VQRIRVAFVASTLDVGGAENVLYNLITGLSERFVARVFTLKAPGRVGQRFASAGLLTKSDLLKRRVDPIALFRLVPALRDFRPDLVFALDHHDAIFWTGVSAPFAGQPRRIVASHTTGRMSSERSFTGVDRYFLKSAACVVALSESHAAYLRDVEGVAGDKIAIIPNGIDVGAFAAVEPQAVAATRRELGLASDERVVTMVAVLRPEKAHEALIEAAQVLHHQHPQARLKYLVVGDGALRRSLEEQAAAKGVDTCVRFLGERDDVARLLHVSDVVVLPSHSAVETLPLALLEAMAAGVPVVASAVGSVPEFVQDGVSGRLIGPADAVGLAEAIWFILSKDEDRRRYVDAARRTVQERYSIERMVGDYEALFGRLVPSDRRPPA